MHKIKICILYLMLPVCLFSQADLRRDNYLSQLSVWKDSARALTASKKLLLNDPVIVQLLPIVSKLQKVQDHPTNWNDGPLVPAKGFQQYLRIGVQAQWKFLELQLAPEMVLAQNQPFNTLSNDLDIVIMRDYYRWYNSIELPTQFGQNPYNKILPGQSFLKFHYKNLSLAASTENMWWGPAERNALLLSNSAAGFPHISFKSEKPILTKVGGFNFEFMTGWLENGMWAPPEDYRALNGNRLYFLKPNKQRVFSGFNISYVPKWFPNLTLGVEQSVVQYKERMKSAVDYIPIKNIISRYPTYIPNNEPITLTAFYLNYEIPKANASVYGEFGWNLNQTTLRNWILQPDKGYASTLGIKKLLHKSAGYNLELLAEITQLQLLTVADQFAKGVPLSWYVGQSIPQGYTNNGKLLGAGVGPGGSSQLIELNWRKKTNRIGLTFERRVHNNDLYVFAFTNSGDFRRFYADFTTTFKMDWQYKKIQFGPRISHINTNNYYWYLFQTSNLFFIPGKDLQQWSAQLNIKYTL